MDSKCCINKCCNCCCTRITSIDEKLRAESEFLTLATNLETVFMFCTISPYIVAFGGVSVVMLQYYYKCLLSENEHDKWTKRTFMRSESTDTKDSSVTNESAKASLFCFDEFRNNCLWLVYLLASCFVVIAKTRAKNVNVFSLSHQIKL